MQFSRLLFSPDKGYPPGGDQPEEDELDFPPPPGGAPEAQQGEESYNYDDQQYPPLTPSQEQLYYQEGQEAYPPLTPSQEQLYYQEGQPPLTPSQEQLYYQEGQEQYPPLTASQEEVYRQQEQQYQQGYEEDPYGHHDDSTPPMAHQFVVGAGYGEPTLDAPEEIAPVEGVERAPLAASDPRYQQLSIGALKERQEGSEFASSYPPPPPPMEFADPTSSTPNPEVVPADHSPFAEPAPRVPGLSLAQHHAGLLPDHEDERDFGEKPQYRAQMFGEHGAAVDEDGVPRYIPALPVIVEEGVLGRRYCGVAWMIFGVLLGLVSYNSGVFSFGTLFFAPVLIVGMLLATGAHWAGTLATVAAVLYFFLYNGAGYLIAYHPEGVALPPILTTLPPQAGIALMWLGFLLPIATGVMNYGSAGALRSISGAMLLVIPAVGLTAWLSFSTSIFRPKLAEVRGSYDRESLSSPSAGYSFSKPSGWATFEWAKARELSPLAVGLKSVPNFFFLNGNQDMMLSLYVDEAPRRTIAGLLGQTVKTPIEEELSRNLPMNQTLATAPFVHNGVEFSETVYTGTTVMGARLHVNVVKGQLGNRTLLIALTRDTHSSRSTQEEADAFLNEVIGSIEIRP